MSTVAVLEAELETVQNDLRDVQEAVGLGDADAIEMEPMLVDQIAELKVAIAEARVSAISSPSPPPPPPTELLPPPPPGLGASALSKSRSNTAAAPSLPSEESRIVLFSPGDSVMAKYSADKQWYAATVIAKTGSSADPVYTVKFTGYPDKETKRKHEVRATENKKRKADAPPSANTVPPTPASPKAAQNGTFISAAPSIDPTLVQKREPSKVSDGPTRMAPAPKKLKGNRTLEKAKSSWNDWQKTGPKKPVSGAASKKLGKDSQFRTPDLPNAKVGFTGSGKPMSKDQVRAKWNYGQEEPDAD